MSIKDQAIPWDQLSGSGPYRPQDQLSGAFVNAELARLRRIESAAKAVLCEVGLVKRDNAYAIYLGDDWTELSKVLEALRAEVGV